MAHHKRAQPKKISEFGAVVDSWPSLSLSSIQGIMAIKGWKIPVSVYRLEWKRREGFPDHYFVRVSSHRDVSLCWNEPFKVFDRKNGAVVLRGRVLLPLGEDAKLRGAKRQLELMEGLLGSEKEMVLANARLGGVKGITETALTEFSALPRETLLKLSRQLEEEGTIRILSFAPLFLLAEESFDFLCNRILAYLSEFHAKHPEDFGASPEKIQKRFGLSRRVLALVLKHLSRTGHLSQSDESVALGDFFPHPTPDEEKLLRDMEEMYMEGELRSVSLEEMQKRLGLSKKKLNRLLSFLVERRKIVLGKDGFFLHSKWLDDVIQKIRNSEKKELRVSDFKQMTGLTRKYAIPLLELLDQMGVTRRRGPTREIIRSTDK
ncbi:MAG: SelB C-terminal domain-containing protein [Candidatus Aminicenantes bacterium]|jgi:selenocysteine-specific elongation factor